MSTKIEIKFDEEGNVKSIIAEDSENTVGYVMAKVSLEVVALDQQMRDNKVKTKEVKE